MAQIGDERIPPFAILDEGGIPILDEDTTTPVDPNVPPPPMPWLAFAVGPSNGNVPTQPVTTFANLSFTDSLTAGPTLSMTIPGKSAAALIIDGLATDVWIYKKQAKKYRLRILPVDQEWGENGEDDALVSTVGYRQVVEARHVVSGPPTFNGVDQGTIIWNLIQHTQAQTAGNLGITPGTILTGQLRDRNEYKIGDELGKLINDLGDVINGVWWGIDADKVLDVRLWSDFPRIDTAIVHGMNAGKVKRSRAMFANAVGVQGADNVTIPVWREASGIGLDQRGRWEAYDASHSSVIDQLLVAQYADGFLEEASNPPSTWTATIDPAAFFDGDSQFEVGDRCELVVPVSAVDQSGAPPKQVSVQIVEIQVATDDNNAATVNVAAVEITG